jgi:hypothetical protein
MVSAYEQLRAEVLRAEARPEGLGAVVYHGMIEGMKLLGTSSGGGGSPAAVAVSSARPIAHDRDLLRLLTNMVLQAQSEVTHVY